MDTKVTEGDNLSKRLSLVSYAAFGIVIVIIVSCLLYTSIATKSDKLKKSQIAAHIKTIKDVLHVKPGTVVIPFSSMSKEGRDEIWNLIDSLVFDEETLLAMKQEEEAKREAKSAAKRAAASQPHKKERWKKTGKPVAKKTKERRDKAKSKKSVNNHKKK